MAISELYFDTGTSISTTEYSLPNDTNYSAGSGITQATVLQALIDFANMVAGDQYEIKIYDGLYDSSPPPSQSLIYHAVLTGPQTGLFVTPSLVLIWNWDVTVKRLAGSDRSIAWSLRGLT